MGLGLTHSHGVFGGVFVTNVVLVSCVYPLHNAATPPQIAPDLTEGDKRDIAAVALRTGIDGLIVSNTTVSRPASVEASPCAQEVRVLVVFPGVFDMVFDAVLCPCHGGVC